MENNQSLNQSSYTNFIENHFNYTNFIESRVYENKELVMLVINEVMQGEGYYAGLVAGLADDLANDAKKEIDTLSDNYKFTIDRDNLDTILSASFARSIYNLIENYAEEQVTRINETIKQYEIERNKLKKFL